MEVSGRKTCNSKKNAKLELQQPANVVDRLSCLSDDLLLSILSLLPLEYAMQTSSLSRRWRCVWMHLDSLRLSYSSQAVDRILALHKGLHLKNLSIDVGYNDGDSSKVDSWVCFAVDRQIEKLELHLHVTKKPTVPYILPECLFICESLVHLKLKNCNFTLPPAPRLFFLKTLYLEGSELSENAVSDVTSQCPQLEMLSLSSCNKHSLLKIELINPNLLTLTIHGLDDYDGEIEINAPHLTSLVFEGELTRQKYVLKNLSSLEKATLNLSDMDDDFNPRDYFDSLIDVLGCLGHVKYLCLCKACLQIISSYYYGESRIAPSIQSLHLEVDTELLKSEIIGLENVFEWTTSLESVKLMLRGEYIYSMCADNKFDSDGDYLDVVIAYELSMEDDFPLTERDLWESMEDLCAIKLHSLKKIEIYGFLGQSLPNVGYPNCKKKGKLFRSRQDELVKNMVENLKALESLSIRTCGQTAIKESSRLGKKLLSFPKASERAKIVFK